MRDAEAIEQTDLTELSVPVHPFAGAGAGDPQLGSDVGDRPGQTSLGEPPTAFYRQRGGWGASSSIPGLHPIGGRRASIGDREELGPLFG